MITSSTNSRIKQIVKYGTKAKARKEADVFLVEGLRMFREIPREDLLETYVTEEFIDNHGAVLDGISYELVKDSVFREISDTVAPQGVLAVVRQRHDSLEEVITNETPLLLVLEHLQDPGNVGTIIRTAEGAGVTGIIMSRDTVDYYNPKVVRATMGAIFRVPVVVEDDLCKTLQVLHECGIQSYAAHLKGVSFYKYSYQKASAFLIGNEGNGLSDALSSVATSLIKIPMLGQVESLNAATAATVLMYEAMRQRLH